ncbi:MAG: hypothetical protein QOJ21_1299, partial [Solirubrobacteraceae bacterium]|nr:hypothetical protein [Solirubrobacteraceae bacterium]
MRIRNITAAAVAIAALGSTAAAGAASAAPSAPATQAATRQVEGTVLSVDRSARTFRLRDS